MMLALSTPVNIPTAELTGFYGIISVGITESNIVGEFRGNISRLGGAKRPKINHLR